LVHVGDPTESVRGGSSIEPDLSARRLLEAGDHVEKRALPASGRPDDADELTVGDAQVERAESMNLQLVTLEDLGDTAKFQALVGIDAAHH
jgi:hypothetical protein